MTRVVLVESYTCGKCPYLVTVCETSWCPILGKDVSYYSHCKVGEDQQDYDTAVRKDLQDEVDKLSARVEELEVTLAIEETLKR